MVKVASLIASTTWSPGSAYNRTSPELSIFLPTFRRGADGLLQKVIKSIAGQTFRDFELIVIDDASTDGSAGIIRDWMARDGRISCLTHPRNIGLPAVSEFEAYLKSRGRFIGFAFDDFIFEPNAFEGLITSARANPESLVHGYAEMVGSSGPHQVLGRSSISYSRLWQDNFIANATVVMPRLIVEAIGLYDPHILAARNCDWDLWRRAQRRYPIVAVPVFVGREHGGSRSDSLGRTYPVFQEIMSEFYGGRNNQALLPTNLPDRDVWAIPTPSSFALAAAAIGTRRFFNDKSWATRETVAEPADLQQLIAPQQSIIGVAGSLEATIPICFDGVRDRFGGDLKFVDFQGSSGAQSQHLLLCDAVIVSRSLLGAPARRAIKLCASAGIDLYHLADDNPILLAQEYPELSEYRPNKVRSVLQPFKAVLATSPRLAEYYKANSLHHDVRMLGPILDRATLDKMRRIVMEAHPDSLRVGFVGGEFRQKDLQTSVYPALHKLSQRLTIELVARNAGATAAASLPPPPFPVAWWPVPFSFSYDSFLQTWRALGLNALVHPKGATLNLDYKTDSILLTSLYLGAVPIVCDEVAFHGIGESEGVLKTVKGADDFATALNRVSDPGFRQEMLLRLERFCVNRFDPAPNEKVLQQIKDATRPVDLIRHYERLTREYARMSTIANEAGIQFGSRTFKMALNLRKIANLARQAKGLFRRHP